jgi:uncharacterized membrane protein
MYGGYPGQINGVAWVAMGFQLLILLIIIGVIVWAISQWSRNSSAPPRTPASSRSAAIDILDERLARGDIDVDEYQLRRSALVGHQ